MGVSAGVLTAGADIVSTALNGIFQGSANRAERRFARQMYGQQREDALSDWNRQNAYDAPSAQMQRFKDAGLNPLLIYGGGSASAGNASPVRSSSPGSYSPKAPQVDIGQAIHDYIDVKMKDQQIDNLKEMNKILFLKQAIGGSQLIGMNLANEYAADTMSDREGVVNAMRAKAQMINDQNEKLMPITLDQARAHLAKIQADTKFTLDENMRKQVMNSANLAVAAKRVLLMQASLENNPLVRSRLIAVTQNLQDDLYLKRLDETLKQQKIGSEDDTFLKAVESVVGHVLNGVLRKGR